MRPRKSVIFCGYTSPSWIRRFQEEIRETMPLPAGSCKFDNSRSKNVLGITYRPFEDMIVDTARSVLETEKALGTNS